MAKPDMGLHTDAYAEVQRTSGMNKLIKELSAVSAAILDHDDPAARKAVLLLIEHTSGIPQKKVKKVVAAMRELTRKYVK